MDGRTPAVRATTYNNDPGVIKARATLAAALRYLSADAAADAARALVEAKRDVFERESAKLREGAR